MEKTLKSIATKNRMQLAGLELFYTKGYYATSVDDILKCLGMSKGAFYYHYQSKEDFMISIIQNLVFRKVYSMLIEPIEESQDPMRAIEDCLTNALETAEHNQLDFGFVLTNFMGEFNGRNPKIMKYLTDIYKVWEVNLVTILQRGKTNGMIARHIDSENVANYIIASYFGIRTLMVDGNPRLLKYGFLQQLRQYLKSIAIENRTLIV